MKYVTEFRDPVAARALIAEITSLAAAHLAMEMLYLYASRPAA